MCIAGPVLGWVHCTNRFSLILHSWLYRGLCSVMKCQVVHVIVHLCQSSVENRNGNSLFTLKTSKEFNSTQNVPTRADNYFTVLHLPRWTPEIRQLQAHGVIRAVHMESMCQPASPGRVNGHVYRTPHTSGTTKSLWRASRASVSFVRGFHRCPSCMCTHLTLASNARRLFDMQVTWLKQIRFGICVYIYTYISP